MDLTSAQKKKFYEEGYLHLRSVIFQKPLNMALRTINHSLGKGIDPSAVPTYRANSFCPELRNAEVITDLLWNSSAIATAEALTEPGKLKLEGGGQIAL